MRDEKEMLDLILGTARKDERIRAVALNGSRANPNVRRDLFQDYDVVYLVTEVEPFIQEPAWVDVFGERIILQCPELMHLTSRERSGRFPYLMLFADGNRLDLTLIPVNQTDAYLREDKLTVILLDKDNALPALPPPTDEGFRVQPPTAELFADCCNEFWWVSAYVAKGLWRREMLYAQDHLNLYVRPMLTRMLEWLAGTQTEFKAVTGKNSKYLQAYLTEADWEQLMATYASGQYEEVWRALFAMTELFRKTARQVAGHMGFAYQEEEDRRVTAYLRHAAAMPPDAQRY
ncbi:aminoglycoside 6-adenylyltransferase [Paenibacillus pinistramenti]|uniref:aminoglycoside 6-adenylyltransferase n=1 Tax=Paenibacillus pinistramenti TaxID=1768003 RepID=UPI0011091402|nr:aminoglycoside 6-adenylyltransferase [Paenibacillus pinistramenti]